MGLFDKLKERFGGDDKPKSFQVTFTERKMGMTIAAGKTNEAVVTGVANGGAAAKAGVRVNDTIASIDGSSSSVAYQDLIQIIGALDRPVVIGFERGVGDGGGEAAGRGGASAQEPGPLKRAQDAARRKMDELKGPPPPPPMTEEAKAERREAALKAAEARTKDWGKRLDKGRQASQTKSATSEVVENQFEDSDNAETRRMVELAKQKEARTAASMGYNPYEARMMGNQAARAAISGNGDSGAGVSLASPPPPIAGQQAGSGAGAAAAASGRRLATPAATKQGEEELIGEEAVLAGAYEAEIDGALGIVLGQDPEVSLVAVTTMLKMMKNMSTNFKEDKFKRIRLGNANFNSKVGGIDGGLEVMTAAGFSLQTDGDEPVLQHGSCDPVPLRLRVAMRKLTQAEAMLKGAGGS